MGTNKHVEQHDRTAERERGGGGCVRGLPAPAQCSRNKVCAVQFSPPPSVQPPPPPVEGTSTCSLPLWGNVGGRFPFFLPCELLSNLAVRRKRSASLPLGSAVHTSWLQRHDGPAAWILSDKMAQPESRLDWPEFEKQRAAQITLRVNY